MFKPAICCIGYNRPESMKRLLSTISKAQYDFDDITLIVSIDSSNKSEYVEQVAREFEWEHGEKIIIRHPEKLGLKKHVLFCGDLCVKYGSLIVLEDDLIVSPGFYNFAVNALNFYGGDARVFAISLYYQYWLPNPKFEFHAAKNGSDAFLAQISVTRGQCWIGHQWSAFKDWLIENDNKLPKYDARMALHAHAWNDETSWGKYEYFYLVIKGLYHVVPYVSYTTNMGDVGEHTAVATDTSQTPLSIETSRRYTFSSFDDCVIYDAFFERYDDSFFAAVGVEKQAVLMDLNGIRYDWFGYRFTYSIQRLPFKAIKSFGANIDPVELNVLYDVPGNSIFLYEIPANYGSPQSLEKVRKYKKYYGRTAHFLNRIPIRLLLKALLANTKKRLISKR